MIVNLQALRALAAYAVVIYHIGDYKPSDLHWFTAMSHVGAAGVDVFFVLSGFIMVFTTRRASTTALEFLTRRVARIVPVYWLMTMVTFALLLVGLKPIGNHEIDVGYLLSSLFFIPVERGAAGAIPLLAVGWTLNFEMFFYLIFAAAIHLAGVGARVYAVIAVLGGLVALGCIIEITNPVVHAFTSPLLLEFLFGVILAGLWEGVAKVNSKTLERSGLACVAVGVTALSVSFAEEVPFGELTGAWRFAWFGGPAFAIVAGALLLEAAKRTVTSQVWQLQGDASYSLYLVHPLVLQVTRKVLSHLPLEGALGFTIRLTVMIAACAICGTLFHKHIERPLGTLFTRRSPRAVSVAVGSSS